jgi:nucleotide-binding universal stress UspA family protein
MWTSKKEGHLMSARPIVLATDGSPSAAEATLEAVALACALDAQLVVVAVEHPPLFAGTGSYGYAELYTEIRKVERKRIEHALEEACAVADEAGVTFEPVHAGDELSVADQICRLAATRKAQMIVVGAHGWSSVGRVLHGSVSTAVVHGARCPVLVVPSARPADQPVETLDEAIRVREQVS